MNERLERNNDKKRSWSYRHTCEQRFYCTLGNRRHKVDRVCLNGILSLVAVLWEHCRSDIYAMRDLITYEFAHVVEDVPFY